MYPAQLTSRSDTPDLLARVMVCDDSAVIRSALARILEADPQIRVLARAGDGQAAIDALKCCAVDVVVLDIEMPIMDGLTALPLLLQIDPGLRVIMASTLTTRGGDITMQAIRLGAAEYMPKPTASQMSGDGRFSVELVAKVKGLARLRRSESKRRPVASNATQPALKAARVPSVLPTSGQTPAPLSSLRAGPSRPPLLLAIGSSTGGPNALFTLIQALSPKLPVPVVLTQHMPAAFTPILANHIDRLGTLPCAEAVEGTALIPGRILLAPGDHHLLVRRSRSGMVAAISDEPAENYCRPSVDPMLRSAAEAVDGRVLVVMLTGMGQDGLLGTRAVVDGGGVALAQDEASSVVWGMPGAITRAGLVHAVLPLSQLAARIMALLGMHR